MTRRVPVDKLTHDEFITCYKLIRNIKSMYEASGIGWDARDKKDEMREQGMEFILLSAEKSAGGEDDKIDAFASFIQDTVEDEERVTFLYEIHVSKKLQGQGIGAKLLDEIKQLSVGCIKLMVFNMNRAAIKFYKQHGFEFVEPELDTKRGNAMLVWRRNNPT